MHKYLLHLEHLKVLWRVKIPCYGKLKWQKTLPLPQGTLKAQMLNLLSTCAVNHVKGHTDSGFIHAGHTLVLRLMRPMQQ